MEQTVIKTDKIISLSLFLISLIFIIGMIYYLVIFFTDQSYQLDRLGERIILFGFILIPLCILNMIELLKPSIILLINENGIQFSQGLRYFYSPWSNIVYFRDSSFLVNNSSYFIFTNSTVEKDQITIGFLNRKDVIEKKTLFSQFFKKINAEINLDLNKINFTSQEILDILSKYSQKYNSDISIIENTSIKAM